MRRTKRSISAIYNFSLSADAIGIKPDDGTSIPVRLDVNGTISVELDANGNLHAHCEEISLDPVELIDRTSAVQMNIENAD